MNKNIDFLSSMPFEIFNEIFIYLLISDLEKMNEKWQKSKKQGYPIFTSMWIFLPPYNEYSCCNIVVI